MVRGALLLVLVLLGACSNATVLPCPYTGTPQYAASAGCLAIVHGRILLVDSRKGGLTPPGGKVRAGESAQCAAHRETLEETGLDLMPGQLLRVFDTGFHLYHCEIHAGSGLIDHAVDADVKRGFWLSVDEFDDVQWRFPGQGEILRDLLTAPP
jgi:8-oxo-dGTP pyrophosphatase MutT (NUDIX family)